MHSISPPESVRTSASGGGRRSASMATSIWRSSSQRLPASILSWTFACSSSSAVISSSPDMGVGLCYCRHKMEHVGKGCKYPQEVCLTFNASAKTLSKHKIARDITVHVLTSGMSMEIADQGPGERR